MAQIQPFLERVKINGVTKLVDPETAQKIWMQQASDEAARSNQRDQTYQNVATNRLANGKLNLQKREVDLAEQQQAERRRQFDHSLNLDRDRLSLSAASEESRARNAHGRLGLDEYLARQKDRQFDDTMSLNRRKQSLNEYTGVHGVRQNDEKLRLDGLSLAERSRQFDQSDVLNQRKQSLAERLGEADISDSQRRRLLEQGNLDLENRRFEDTRGLDRAEFERQLANDPFEQQLERDRLEQQTAYQTPGLLGRSESDVKGYEQNPYGMTAHQGDAWRMHNAKSSEDQVAEIRQFMASNQFAPEASAAKSKVMQKLTALENARGKYRPEVFSQIASQVIDEFSNSGLADMVKPPPTPDELYNRGTFRIDDDNIGTFDADGNVKINKLVRNSTGEQQASQPESPEIEYQKAVTVQDAYKNDPDGYLKEIEATKDRMREEWGRKPENAEKDPRSYNPSPAEVNRRFAEEFDSKQAEKRAYLDALYGHNTDIPSVHQGSSSVAPSQQGAKRNYLPPMRKDPTPEEAQARVDKVYASVKSRPGLEERILADPNVKILADRVGGKRAVAAVTDPEIIADMSARGSKDPVRDIARMYAGQFASKGKKRGIEPRKFSDNFLGAMYDTFFPPGEQEEPGSHRGQHASIGSPQGSPIPNNPYPIERPGLGNPMLAEHPGEVASRAANAVLPRIESEAQMNDMISKGLIQAGDWFHGPDGKQYQVQP